MDMKRDWTVAALLAAAVAAAVAIWLVRSHEPAPAAAAGQPAAAPSSGERDTLRYADDAPQLAMIQSRIIPSTPLPLSDPLSARVAYDEDVTARIGTSLAGRVVAIKAAPGDVVKAGQVLAEIDSPDAGTAYADLDKARADEERKRLAMERARELTPGEGIAGKEWEAAQADFAQARTETVRAERRLKNLNPYGHAINGQRIALASPLSGVVTERTATPALEVGPGMAAPLFVVTDRAHLWLMIDVPEKLLGRIRPGSTVTVDSDAYPDEHFTATIVQPGQTVDPNTRRALARARLDNPAGKLLPEMFVRASVLQSSGTGVPVPNGAIVNRGTHAIVFVRTAPGEFRRREVKLLTHGSDFSYVGEGLRGDEDVVTAGALLLDAELDARAGNAQ